MTVSIEVVPRRLGESIAIHGLDGRKLVTVYRDHDTHEVSVSWPGTAGATPQEATEQARALLLAIEALS